MAYIFAGKIVQVTFRLILAQRLVQTILYVRKTDKLDSQRDGEIIKVNYC